MSRFSHLTVNQSVQRIFDRGWQPVEDRKRELLSGLRALADDTRKTGRPFTPAERERVADDQAELAEIKRLEQPMPRLTQPDRLGDGSPYSHSAPVRGGKLFADMFGSDSLSSGGWQSAAEFLGVVQSGLHDPRLRREQLAMSEGVPASGGYVVPTEHVAAWLDKSLESEIVRPRARIEPMTSDVKKISGFHSLDHTSGSLYGGFTSQWMAEENSITEKTPAYREIQLNAKKLGLFTKASNELVSDGMSFEAMLNQALVSAVGWHLDYAFLRGTGAGQPMGVLNDPALIPVTKETSQVAATVMYENLVKMFSRMHPACVSNSIWVANPTTIPQLLQLSVTIGTTGNHVPVLQESNGQFVMLTRPVLFTEKLPALGTVGDIILADFSQYVVGMRKEMSLEKSMHVGFQTDQSAYRIICRVDGQGMWSQALTPVSGSTLSWCVALQTRA